LAQQNLKWLVDAVRDGVVDLVADVQAFGKVEQEMKRTSAKQWPMAYEIANTLNRELLQDEFGGVHAAVALYRMGRTREAKELSLDVAERFPKDWSVRYNLACYCAQLMEFDAAQEWFKAAIELNETLVKRMAVDDPDLEPLWQAMRDTTWKRTG